MTDQEIYNQLSFYTLSLREPEFIHQHLVDAYAASHPEREKNIRLAFALIGLYLFAEKRVYWQTGPKSPYHFS
jgi:hypothetical protein